MAFVSARVNETLCRIHARKGKGDIVRLPYDSTCESGEYEWSIRVNQHAYGDRHKAKWQRKGDRIYALGTSAKLETHEEFRERTMKPRKLYAIDSRQFGNEPFDYDEHTKAEPFVD